ncbi:MAG TPA: NYN domain-containing protein [Candidatus Pacearchaeota archaeon]|nr:NYN domain-containing protein [Candidatus Pacearchaeota archaeon]
MKKSKEQRVGVFIDVQNLYHTAKNIYKTRVDFGQILKEAIDGRKLIRAFAYVIRTKGGEEKAFFDALSQLGIETRVKDLKEFYSGVKKANWDVGLAVDAIRVGPGVDVVVIVSGDGDFAPLVEYLKNRGKRVEVVAFGKTTAQELIEVADEFINLDQNSGHFLMKEKFYSRLIKNQ